MDCGHTMRHSLYSRHFQKNDSSLFKKMLRKIFTNILHISLDMRDQLDSTHPRLTLTQRSFFKKTIFRNEIYKVFLK